MKHFKLDSLQILIIELKISTEQLDCAHVNNGKMKERDEKRTEIVVKSMHHE